MAIENLAIKTDYRLMRFHRRALDKLVEKGFDERAVQANVYVASAVGLAGASYVGNSSLSLVLAVISGIRAYTVPLKNNLKMPAPSVYRPACYVIGVLTSAMGLAQIINGVVNGNHENYKNGADSLGMGIGLVGIISGDYIGFARKK